MYYGEFKELVKDTLARGDEPEVVLREQDDGSPAPGANVLDRMIRMALHQIERQWDFRFMERLVEFTVEEGQHRIGQPRNLKRIVWFRVTDGERQYYLLQDDGGWFALPQEGMPGRYWLEGRQQIFLDAKAPQALDGELLIIRFSDLPLADDGTVWILDHAPDVLLARTMMNFAGWVREDTKGIYDYWLRMFEDGITQILNEDSRFRESNPMGQLGYPDARAEYTGRW